MAMRSERNAVWRRESYLFESSGSSARAMPELAHEAANSDSDIKTHDAAENLQPGNGLWKDPSAVFERKTSDDKRVIMPDGETVVFRNFSDPTSDSVDGSLTSPIIRVREGQQAQIKLETRQCKRRSTVVAQGIGARSQMRSAGLCTETVASHTYQWQPRSAGTWFYQSHASSPHQFEMGLYGVIVVDAEPDHNGRPRAYHNGPTYDIERIWVFDDVDPSWHSDDAAEQAANNGRLTSFKPKYFLINGVPNTETLHHPDVAIEAKLGDTLLLRLMNASFSLVKVEIERLNADIISVDGQALGSEERPWTHWISVAPQQPVRLATASRHDLLINLDPALGGFEGPGEYRVTIEFLDGARRQVQNTDASHPAHVGRAATTIRVL